MFFDTPINFKSLNVYNGSGKEIFYLQNNLTQQIDVSYWQNGYYYLYGIDENDQKYSATIAIQN